jgi:hypothetical protein
VNTMEREDAMLREREDPMLVRDALKARAEEVKTFALWAADRLRKAAMLADLAIEPDAAPNCDEKWPPFLWNAARALNLAVSIMRGVDVENHDILVGEDRESSIRYLLNVACTAGGIGPTTEETPWSADTVEALTVKELRGRIEILMASGYEPAAPEQVAAEQADREQLRRA